MRNGLSFLAVLCFAAAVALYAGSRWVASNDLAPGDDTPFTLMMLAPASLLLGTVLSATAWRMQPGGSGLARAALIVNGGLLFLAVAAGVFWAFTYQGR